MAAFAKWQDGDIPQLRQSQRQVQHHDLTTLRKQAAPKLISTHVWPMPSKPIRARAHEPCENEQNSFLLRSEPVSDTLP